MIGWGQQKCVEMNFPATFRKSNKLDFSVQTSALRSLVSSLTCHPFSPAPHLLLTETIPFQSGRKDRDKVLGTREFLFLLYR